MSHILIVEPQDEVLNLLEASLIQEGFQLVQANNKKDALERAREIKPALVLMASTLRPPDEEGTSFDICKQFKGDPEIEGIPIIFMGQEASGLKDLQRILECGANDFISLNQDIADVIVRLQFSLRYKRSLDHSEALAKELGEVNDQIYQRNLQVEKDLHTARQLQQSLLPNPIDNITPEMCVGEMQLARCHYLDEQTRITGMYVPCDALGGDLYDVMKFKDNTIGITVADVSGHGVPAGFITALFKASFYRTTHTFQSPDDILFNLNNELAKIITTGEYITAIYCRLEDDGRKLLYSGAGHPYPMHYRAKTKDIVRLTENGPPLVWFNDMDYPVGEAFLEPGDKVLIFTDGISEMKEPNRTIYGEEELEALFLQHAQQGAGGQLVEAMLQELSDFTQGHPLEDDMSLILLEARS